MTPQSADGRPASGRPGRSRTVATIAGLGALAAFAIGVFVRFDGLGSWPLSVDEYYLTKSILSILDDGLPGFACGGYYIRGLLQQYVTSLLVSAVSPIELAVRLYPVFFNLATIGLAYLLARRIGGVVVASLTVVILSLSVWEIEMARFARMYAPFQALFVAQILFWHRTVTEGRPGNVDGGVGSNVHSNADRDFKWMLLIAVAGVLTYKGAAFLAVPPLIALLRRPALVSVSNVSLLLAVLLLTYLEVAVNLRVYGVTPPEYPPEIAEFLAGLPSGSILSLPDTRYLRELATTPFPLLVSVSLVAAGVIVFVRRFRNRDWRLGAAWLAAVAALGTGFPLLAAAVFVPALLLLTDDEHRLRLFRDPVPLLYWLAGFALWSLVGWFSFAEPREFFTDYLLAFPDSARAVALPWLKAIPVTTLGMGAVIALGALAFGRSAEREARGFYMLIGLIVAFAAGVGLVATPVVSTRYSFFLYPLVVIAFCLAAVRLAGRLPLRSGYSAAAAAAFALALFAAGEDFDLRHLARIDSAEINYRIGFGRHLHEHYKRRSDYRGPAEYVNRRRRPDEPVVIGESAPDLYLDRVDYRYKRMTENAFENHISCGLDRDVWADVPVLYKEEQLAALRERSAERIWIVDDAGSLRDWDRYEVYRTEDGRTRVLRVPGNAAPVKSPPGRAQGSHTSRDPNRSTGARKKTSD